MSTAKSLLIVFLSCLSIYVNAQVSKTDELVFSKADSLRGSLSSKYRTCYDINFYHLNIQVDIEKQFISGSNEFSFTALSKFKTLQFDLFDNLQIDQIIYKGKPLSFKREFNAVFVSFPKKIKKGSKDKFTVFYSGKPVVAKNAPWDGGFVFSKDDKGKPFVATACQGFGASSWWPNKDQQWDEVDSMLISVSVPNGLQNISNGRLISTKQLANGFTQFNWFVSYPINNYGVALNIADYAHFSDGFKGKNGNLSIDYFVLPENLEKAKIHFDADVKRMLEAFEHWFGPYPFYKDGFKLIETPFLGMEHQSAIAYGNKYVKGYRGTDLSETRHGLKWDFIIVHEAGHEWFGNHITAKDIADMWIHESFTNYSESLFTEYWYGKKAGDEYVIGLRKRVKNDIPIIGPYGVNKEGSGDMYFKGANMLHTIRTIINDDEKWRSILIGMNTKFGMKTTTTEDIVKFINKESNLDFTKVFDQYLRYTSLPVLEYSIKENELHYRWLTDVEDFDMPIEISLDNSYKIIYPNNQWKSLKLDKAINKLIIKEDYFIDVKKL